MDDNLPLLEDATSWLEIVSRYDVERSANHHLLMQRRGRAVPFTRAAERSARVHFGEEVLLPDVGEDLLWCAIDVQPTLTTRLLSVVARPPALTMQAVGGPDPPP